MIHAKALALFLSLAPGTHTATVVKVVDGDTVNVDVPAWKRTPFEQISIRIAGIDTPESLTQFAKCPKELAAGLAAKQFAQTLVVPNNKIVFKYLGHDKYFRIDASVRLPSGKNWATVMINSGMARPYNGGTKSSWC